jgi:hypothetical protein
MFDKLLGRKSRWNWGKNSKNELRLIEKRQFVRDTFEELAQDKDEELAEEQEEEYKQWLAKYWVNHAEVPKS